MTGIYNSSLYKIYINLESLPTQNDFLYIIQWLKKWGNQEIRLETINTNKFTTLCLYYSGAYLKKSIHAI